MQIVRHVEAWDVSAVGALLLLLKPSERAVWRRRQGTEAATAGSRAKRRG